MVTPERPSLVNTGRFHRESISDAESIHGLLDRLRQQDGELRIRVNRSMRLETARIEHLSQEELALRVRNFEPDGSKVIHVNFELEEVAYFFVAARLSDDVLPLVRLKLPAHIFRADRRERVRRAVTDGERTPSRVALQQSGKPAGEARVADYSAVGLGLEVEEPVAEGLARELGVRFLDGPWIGESRWAEIRHQSQARNKGWIRLGVQVSSVPQGRLASVERRERILPVDRLGRARQTLSFLAKGVQYASARSLSWTRFAQTELRPEIIDYPNEQGERVRAIVESTGPRRGALAVVIPPAWGRTKETLSPLAAVLKETFRRERIPAVILRFDGVRRRGESHNAPECLAPGSEQLRYTLSQGVSDIMGTLAFLEQSPEFQTRGAILVTFSAAALDGRKAVVRDAGRRLRGWVSVVGMPELQHCMRVISGGVDYPVAVERGIRLGVQEILGVPVDVDCIVGDAVENGFAYLEDGRRDMAAISVPITWIHGKYDAWMEIDRVRAILGCGDTTNRRLLEVPTGHQLGTSREALEVFQLISIEAGRMALGRELRPAVPSLVELERRRQAERARLSRPKIDTMGFWRDFLLGRDRRIGVDWLGATSAYQRLMEQQIHALQLEDGQTIADLGAGTGPLPVHLAGFASRPHRLTVDEIDFVKEGLTRARSRLERFQSGLRVRYVVCNLDGVGAGLPFRAETYDRVLASLVISYLADPRQALAFIREILRPGGRLVFSTLKRDADLSKLYVEAIEELRAGRAREIFGAEAEELVIRSAPDFLNQASRLLDFEEQGAFQFWDRDEAIDLVRRSGFEDVQVVQAFGEPPQALLVVARKP